MTTGDNVERHLVDDPLPDPEPAAPSLPEPDPGVFHHDVGEPLPQEKTNA